LLEALIVVTIFGTVIATGSSFLISGTKLYRTGVKQQESLIKVSKSISGVEKFLSNASIIKGADTTGTWINFQIPTQVEGNYLKFTTVNGTSTCQGCYWGDGVPVSTEAAYNAQPRMIRLKFVPATKGGTVITVTEASVDCDINGDGDKNDEFERGAIVKVTVLVGPPVSEVADTTEQISHGNWLLRESDASLASVIEADRRTLFARMNSDLSAIDSVTGRNMRVMLFGLEEYAGGKVLPFRRTLLIAPLNQNALGGY